MASKYGSRIEYSGPLFTKDIKATFRQNARDLLSEMAADGAGLVQQNLTPGRGRLTGNYADLTETGGVLTTSSAAHEQRLWWAATNGN